MDVGRQGLARSAQLGCVMLVEFVPLVAFAGLAHVRRRGHGSLGSGQSVLDEDDRQADEHHDDRQHHGDGHLRDDIRNHGHDCARWRLAHTNVMRAGMDEAWVTCADPDRSAGGGAQPGPVRGRRCSGPCASP